MHSGSFLGGASHLGRAAATLTLSPYSHIRDCITSWSLASVRCGLVGNFEAEGYWFGGVVDCLDVVVM